MTLPAGEYLTNGLVLTRLGELRTTLYDSTQTYQIANGYLLDRDGRMVVVAR